MIDKNTYKLNIEWNQKFWQMHVIQAYSITRNKLWKSFMNNFFYYFDGKWCLLQKQQWHLTNMNDMQVKRLFHGFCVLHVYGKLQEKNFIIYYIENVHKQQYPSVTGNQIFLTHALLILRVFASNKCWF